MSKKKEATEGTAPAEKQEKQEPKRRMKPHWVHLRSKGLLQLMEKIDQSDKEQLVIVNGYQAYQAHGRMLDRARTHDRVYVGNYLVYYYHPLSGEPRDLATLEPEIREAIEAQEAKWRVDNADSRQA